MSKDVEMSLVHAIEFNKKHNEPLAENTVKNKMEQLFSKYMHKKNIHEHENQ